MLPRLLLHAQFGTLRAGRQDVLDFPAIEARRQPDFFVTGTPTRTQVSGQRFGETPDELNPHQGFELRAVDANADTNIDDRIERRR